MPNRSNASDSPIDRAGVAHDLYIQRGATDAGQRCEVNTQLGQRDFTAELSAHLALRPGQTLLDVGCGNGRHLAAFARELGDTGLALGSDFAMDAVRSARDRGASDAAAATDGQVEPAGIRLRFLAADGGRLPLVAGTVDAIHCAYAVYYLGDLRQALLDWHRVLRHGGRIVVSGPAADTNAELYDFHHRATGCEPSDADRMALGYVDQQVAAHTTAAGFTETRRHRFVNSVVYDQQADFLTYWQASSLFLRTVPPAERSAAVERAANLLDQSRESMAITKCTTILVASKP